MDQVETIFQLDSVDLNVGDDGGSLFVIGREINQGVAGQLHPQPVCLEFTVPQDQIQEMFIDLNALCTEGYEIKCIGAFAGESATADLYDYFHVAEFSIAHDYIGEPDEEESLADDAEALDDETVEAEPATMALEV